MCVEYTFRTAGAKDGVLPEFLDTFRTAGAKDGVSHRAINISSVRD